MDNPRPEKVAVVAEVKEKLENSEAVVLTEYRGLNVGQMAELRKALREAGGEYRVYKNTLARFAAAELDLDIGDMLTGPTALAFTTTSDDGPSGDAATISKAIVEFNKANENLVIKGGLLDGEVLTVDKIEALSKLPSRDVLLAQFAGGLAAPMQKFAALLKALPQNLAYGLAALIEEGGAPGAPAADAAPAPSEESASDEEPAPSEESAADAAPAPSEASADEPAPSEESAADAAPAPSEASASDEEPASDNETEEE